MGFSVSGSAAIVFAGLLIAFGMWHTAGSNSFEQVTEAQSDRSDAALDTKNTDFTIDSASFATGTLVIDATNEGSTALGLNRTDLLIDNVHEPDWQANATVDGDGTTDLWLPGETLTIEVSMGSSPARVKLATEGGVSDAEVVS